eukprot:6183191-Pleurochrysis_carterae.AAC.1
MLTKRAADGVISRPRAHPSLPLVFMLRLRTSVREVAVGTPAVPSAVFCRDQLRFHSATCLNRFSPGGSTVSSRMGRSGGRRKKAIESAREQNSRTSVGAALRLSLDST